MIIFQTPTLLDPKCLTVMGLSAKPNTSTPIGFFGTGLKYAIAVLCRLEIPFRLMIGKKEVQFRVNEEEFRGEKVKTIKMKYGFTWQDLPFTTHYGANWQLWMAFRELYTNTIDEGGITFRAPNNADGYAGHTRIMVLGYTFDEIFQKKNDIFLDDNDPNYDGPVQIIKKPTRFIYYRGLRIMESDKELPLTYNIRTYTHLTEDRTPLYPDYLWTVIGSAVAQLDDKQMIASALQGKLAQEIVFCGTYPSASFREVAKTNPIASQYVAKIDKKEPYPKPFRIDKVLHLIDGNNKHLAKCFTKDFANWLSEKLG